MWARPMTGIVSQRAGVLVETKLCNYTGGSGNWITGLDASVVMYLRLWY